MVATLAAAPEEVCVCDFTDGLPLNQPTISHHLRILREAGIATCRRRGSWVYYTLVPGAADKVREAVRSVFLPSPKRKRT